MSAALTLLAPLDAAALAALTTDELKDYRERAMYAINHSLDDEGHAYYEGMWLSAVDEYKRRRIAGTL